MKWFVLMMLALPVRAFAAADFGVWPDAQRPAIGSQTMPVVAAGDGVTWVAWHDQSPNTLMLPRVVVARLGPTGALLDAPGLTMAMPTVFGKSPALGVCGGHVMVAWVARVPDTQSATALYASELTVSGQTVSASAPVAVQQLGVSQPTVRLVSATPACALVMSSASGWLASSFVTAPSGTPVTLSTSGDEVSAVWDGAQFIAAFRDSLTGVTMSQRFTLAGVVSPPETWPGSLTAMALATVSGTTWRTQVAGGALVAQPFDGAGQPLSMPVSVTSTTARGLAAAALGSKVAMLTSNEAAPAQVVLSTTDLSGAVSASPVTLTTTEKTVSNLALTPSGSGVQAVFTQVPRPVDGLDVWGAAFDANASQGVTVPVSQAAALERRQFLTSHGRMGFAGWTEVRWVDRGTSYSYVNVAMVARFDGSGVMLDQAGLEVSSGANSNVVIGVSATASGFLVAWLEQPTKTVWVRTVDGQSGALGVARQVLTQVDQAVFNGHPGAHLLAARVSGAGVVQSFNDQGSARGAQGSVSSSVFGQLSGSEFVLADDGTSWLLGRKQGATLTLVPVDANGQPGVAVSRTMGNVVNEVAPTLVGTGQEWLAAWFQGNGQPCHQVERFDGAMNSLGTGSFANSCALDSLGISWDGTKWVTVARSRTFDAAGYGQGLDVRSFDATLQPLGDAVLLEDDTFPFTYPVLHALVPGTTVMSWVRRVNEAPFGTDRVRFRVWPQPLAVLDAGVDGGHDAGVDAGVADAGVADAGVADAGVADAGVADAGAADAGIVDAGSEPADGGVDGQAAKSGCSCGVDGSLAWLAAGVFLGRRRGGAKSPERGK